MFTVVELDEFLIYHRPNSSQLIYSNMNRISHTHGHEGIRINMHFTHGY